MVPRLRFAIPFVAITGLIIATMVTWADEKPRKLQPQVFMQVKLSRSEETLRGLVTRDFAAISKAAQDMKEMSEATQWPRAHDQVYEHYSADFRRHCDKLNKLAKEKNLDGAAYTFQKITASCITCHEYVRERLKPAPNPSGPFQLIPGDWK